MDDADLVTALIREREAIENAKAHGMPKFACELRLRWDSISSLMELAAARLANAPEEPRTGGMSYPQLVGLKAQAQHRLREREVLRNKITHSKVREAWDAFYGPQDANDRHVVEAVDRELARRKESAA